MFALRYPKSCCTKRNQRFMSFSSIVPYDIALMTNVHPEDDPATCPCDKRSWCSWSLGKQIHHSHHVFLYVDPGHYGDQMCDHCRKGDDKGSMRVQVSRKKKSMETFATWQVTRRRRRSRYQKGCRLFGAEYK
jgi:hypothetical protein